MMSNGEKVDRAIELIRKASFVRERFDVNEICESFRDQELITLAETITDLINLVNDLRDILENDNR